MNTFNNGILLSFVLPVYNVETYLCECVDSILQQATAECEIILVDDGSTDRSGEICDAYAEDHKNVKVIHKENGGLSSARNCGLKAACGKYVTFVDSDDKIFLNSVDLLLSWIRSYCADICFLRAEKLYSDGSLKDMGEAIVRSALLGQSREAAISHLTSRPKYPGSAWAKLFKREFLINNDIHFPYDRRYSEDLGFIRDCILNAHDLDALEMAFYQYRQNREGSITSNITKKNFDDLLLFVSESVDLLTDGRMEKDTVSRYLMSFVAYEYSVLMYLINHISTDEKAEAYRKLKNYKWTLRFGAGKKVKIIALMADVLGIRITSVLLKLYRKAVQR